MTKLKNLFITHWVFLVFTIFYISFSLLTYKLFPIGADEEYRYLRGKELLSHFLYNSQTKLQTSVYPSIEPDSYYFYVMLLNILNPNFYYEHFHLQNMIFAFIAFLSIYLIAYEYTKNSKFSVLAPVLLFLTPSFSGHIAANPIDVPFASFFLLNLYLIFKYKDIEFSFKKSLILGLSFWPVLTLRPVGFEFFLVFLVTAFFLTSGKISKSFTLNQFKTLILVFIISNFLLVITWPYVGINYFKNLPNILFVNSSYDKWDNIILFNGSIITKEERPWYYLFQYIFLTTPSFVLILGAFSLLFLKKVSKIKHLILFVLLLNFTLYLLLDPVIYNGLRHFLFLIPLLVLLGIFGLWDLINSKLRNYIKYGVIFFALLSVICTTFELIKLFPNHYSYFNEISGGVERNIYKYETDYWGGNYKEAAIFVRDSFPDKKKVYACNLGFGVDYYIGKKHEVLIDSEDADLIICDVILDQQRGYDFPIVHQTKLGNEDFVYIRQVK